MQLQWEWKWINNGKVVKKIWDIVMRINKNKNYQKVSQKKNLPI